MSLKEEILAILKTGKYYSDFHCEVSEFHCEVSEIRDGFQIKYGMQYEAPELNLEKLIQLSVLFGTTKIDVDDYAYSGCESCDWGSDYGHELQIYNPTKNVEELKALVGHDL